MFSLLRLASLHQTISSSLSSLDGGRRNSSLPLQVFRKRFGRSTLRQPAALKATQMYAPGMPRAYRSPFPRQRLLQPPLQVPTMVAVLRRSLQSPRLRRISPPSVDRNHARPPKAKSSAKQHVSQARVVVQVIQKRVVSKTTKVVAVSMVRARHCSTRPAEIKSDRRLRHHLLTISHRFAPTRFWAGRSTWSYVYGSVPPQSAASTEPAHPRMMVMPTSVSSTSPVAT